MRSTRLGIGDLPRTSLVLGAMLLAVVLAFTFATVTLTRRIETLEDELTARMDYGDRRFEQYAEKAEANFSRVSFQCVTLKTELQRAQYDIDDLQGRLTPRDRR